MRRMVPTMEPRSTATGHRGTTLRRALRPSSTVSVRRLPPACARLRFDRSGWTRSRAIAHRATRTVVRPLPDSPPTGRIWPPPDGTTKMSELPSSLASNAISLSSGDQRAVPGTGPPNEVRASALLPVTSATQISRGPDRFDENATRLAVRRVAAAFVVVRRRRRCDRLLQDSEIDPPESALPPEREKTSRDPSADMENVFGCSRPREPDAGARAVSRHAHDRAVAAGGAVDDQQLAPVRAPHRISRFVAAVLNLPWRSAGFSVGGDGCDEQVRREVVLQPA